MTLMKYIKSNVDTLQKDINALLKKQNEEKGLNFSEALMLTKKEVELDTTLKIKEICEKRGRY